MPTGAVGAAAPGQIPLGASPIASGNSVWYGVCSATYCSVTGGSIMKEIIAIIVAVTAFLCAVAAEIIVFAETGPRAQKPIPADLDETSGGRMPIDRPRLFQCFHRDLFPRASLQSEPETPMRCAP